MLDYICQITATIKSPGGHLFDITTACPVQDHSTLSVYDPNLRVYRKVPFFEGIEEKGASRLAAALPGNWEVSFKAIKQPRGAQCFCDSSINAITKEFVSLIITYFDYEIYTKTK